MAKDKIRPSRREFVKKAAYVPPAILSLAAAPNFAKAGSVKNQNENDQGQNQDQNQDQQ